MAARAPLDDVKVLDLMWVMAGPAATRVLADYGATVVRVESTQRLDTARTLAPYNGGRPGPEGSGIFQNLNAGKLTLTLDLAHPDGRAVLLDLVRWADVVAESFSPRAMRASCSGLAYELRRHTASASIRSPRSRSRTRSTSAGSSGVCTRPCASMRSVTSRRSARSTSAGGFSHVRS